MATSKGPGIGNESKTELKSDVQKTEQVARENAAHYSNGNRKSQASGKVGGAERGGPDLDKAETRQPPHATR